jgi:hypothetical protein
MVPLVALNQPKTRQKISETFTMMIILLTISIKITKIFENNNCRKIFGSKKVELNQHYSIYIAEHVIYTAHLALLG